MLFDKETQRLVAIDYTDTRHVFSEWKITAEGHHYPSHVVGYRFADRAVGKLNAKQWYQTDVLELTSLKELPAEPIRFGKGWAIHAQREPADWTKLVVGGNLVAKKLVTPEAAPNDHNTGSELLHLTDGVLAGAEGRMWSDKRAMGWAYQPYVRLKFDLGAPQPVDSVVIRLLGGAAQ